MKTPSDQPTRESILEHLASLTRMRRGTLSEHFVQRLSSDGKEAVRLGPYFKFQIWQDGGNHKRGVSASEASELREDIENYRLFKQLTDQLADLTIEQTIALRATEATATGRIAEKKPPKPMPRRNIPGNGKLPRPSPPKNHPERRTPPSDGMVRDRTPRRLCPRRAAHRRGVAQRPPTHPRRHRDKRPRHASPLFSHHMN